MNNSTRRAIIGAMTLLCCILFLSTAGVSAGPSFPAIATHPKIEHQHPYLRLAASKESDQIQTKVVVTKRRRHGDFMDINFRMEFSSVPQGKEYDQCFWDMGMKLNGAKPGCIGPGLVWPDKDGKMVVYLQVTDFVQGEWIQVTIKSTDGRVRKSIRFTPFK